MIPNRISYDSAMPLATIVAETHEISRGDKICCPFHEDRVPSCHIYMDHYHCFSCGAHGDTVDWLRRVSNLSFQEAMSRLENNSHQPKGKPLGRVNPVYSIRNPAGPLSFALLNQHLEKAVLLQHVPLALAGRGFTLEDLQGFGVAADGEDAIIPITGPTADVLALKRRYANPRGNSRYSYDTPGCGAPAWCSLNLRRAYELLIIEGELNGMASSLARPDFAVVGVAGANGELPLEMFSGRIVYLCADDDEAGHMALERWQHQIRAVEPAKIFLIPPWELDACEIAGRMGRAALRERLT